MFCKVRNYQLIPDPKNLGKPLKANENINHMIYDETMYFPIKFQQRVLDSISFIVKKYKQLEDQEKSMNNLIDHMKINYGLTTFKPLFPKENLGVLIGDPFFNFY